MDQFKKHGRPISAFTGLPAIDPSVPPAIETKTKKRRTRLRRGHIPSNLATNSTTVAVASLSSDAQTSVTSSNHGEPSIPPMTAPPFVWGSFTSPRPAPSHSEAPSVLGGLTTSTSPATPVTPLKSAPAITSLKPVPVVVSPKPAPVVASHALLKLKLASLKLAIAAGSHQPAPAIVSHSQHQLCVAKPVPVVASLKPVPIVASLKPAPAIALHQPAPAVVASRASLKLKLASLKLAIAAGSHQPAPAIVSHQPAPAVASPKPVPVVASLKPVPIVASLKPAPAIVLHQPAPAVVASRASLKPAPAIALHQPAPAVVASHSSLKLKPVPVVVLPKPTPAVTPLKSASPIVSPKPVQPVTISDTTSPGHPLVIEALIYSLIYGLISLIDMLVGTLRSIQIFLLRFLPIWTIIIVVVVAYQLSATRSHLVKPDDVYSTVLEDYEEVFICSSCPTCGWGNNSGQQLTNARRLAVPPLRLARLAQLQRDRDVVAQLEAIRGLARHQTELVSSVYTRTVLVTNYFHRIRAGAALALFNCATDQLVFIGLFHLFKIFLRYCHTPQNKGQDLFSHKYVPMPNDFSDFSEYFVRKAVLTAIAQVRFANGKTPPIVRRFLIDQLRYNDNTNNAINFTLLGALFQPEPLQFSNARYISCVINALVTEAPPTFASPQSPAVSLTFKPPCHPSLAHGGLKLPGISIKPPTLKIKDEPVATPTVEPALPARIPAPKLGSTHRHKPANSQPTGMSMSFSAYYAHTWPNCPRATGGRKPTPQEGAQASGLTTALALRLSSRLYGRCAGRITNYLFSGWMLHS
ncbi:hypothetical protein BKA62DRAFT_767506 [Auriculariales sp. MPI-PUGE-AT-0066]|nr:hypothetical protein BKA62DRAFT_767506 [Auriculariales sp. MPI-PUGE-AT-0066]